jgi:hypothetical protein
LSDRYLVRGHIGLGDNIYQRSFVRRIAEHGECWLQTPWPELYEDIPGVRFVRMAVGLRTQAKNIERQPHSRWSRPPADCKNVRLHYSARAGLPGHFAQFRRNFPFPTNDLRFDLPDTVPPWAPNTKKTIAFVRPVTERVEWPAPARSPDPDYIWQACEILRDQGYHVVLVTDLAPNAEMLSGRTPPHDTAFLHGQPHIAHMLGLLKGSAIAVGGSGWIVPAALAAGVPLVLIGGGCGAVNSPEWLTDPAMDTSRFFPILPDNYCRCADRWHDCDKSITAFVEKFQSVVGMVAT